MGLEAAIVKYLSSLRDPALTEIMVVVTSLGSISFALILTLLAYIEDYRETTADLFIGLVLTNIVVYPLKFLVARPRPETIASAVSNWIATPAFPSGHTATAFLLATVLSEKLETRFLYVLAVAVGFSRIYLGLHYPIDVITGAVLGLAAGKLAVRYDIEELPALGNQFSSG